MVGISLTITSLTNNKTNDNNNTLINNIMYNLSNIRPIYPNGGSRNKTRVYVPSDEINNYIHKVEGSDYDSAEQVEARKGYVQHFNRVFAPAINSGMFHNNALDALYDYAYNVGVNGAARRVMPYINNYINGKGNYEDIIKGIYAAGDKKARGLRNRREYEKSRFINNRFGSAPKVQYIAQPDATRVAIPAIQGLPTIQPIDGTNPIDKANIVFPIKGIR